MNEGEGKREECLLAGPGNARRGEENEKMGNEIEERKREFGIGQRQDRRRDWNKKKKGKKWRKYVGIKQYVLPEESPTRTENKKAAE